MHLKNLVFYVTLIVSLKLSIQYDIEDDYYDSNEELLSTTPYTEVEENTEWFSAKENFKTEVSIRYEYKNITVKKGDDLVIKCESDDGNAEWLNVQHNSGVLITATSDGISELSISNITKDYRFDCQRPNNTIQRFVVTVNGPLATIVNRSSDFVRKGTNLLITCVVRSVHPIDTAYLRYQNKQTANKWNAQWETKKRICSDNNYNRTDCAEETTFHFDVEVTDSGVYFCGYEDAESLGLYVEVINSAFLLYHIQDCELPPLWEKIYIFKFLQRSLPVSEPTIHETVGRATYKYVQSEIIKIALEALEKHGLTKDAATHIRQKCDVNFRAKQWNCIIGRMGFEYSMSQDVQDEFRFSLGSIFVSVFRPIIPLNHPAFFY